MRIKLHLLPEEGLRVEGEDPPSALDFPEPMFRFERPVRYELEISPLGADRVLARGRLSTVVSAHCVRTLEWFDLPVEVEDFVCEAEVNGDEVDLTPHIREDILLALPSHPVSSGTQPLAARPPSTPGPDAGVWKQLDQLNIQTKGPGKTPRPPRPQKRLTPPRG